MSEAEKREGVIPPGEGSERLDRALARLWPDLSRSRLQALIREGQVTLEEAPAGDPSAKVMGGQRVAVTVPPPRPAEPEPEARDLAVVHEDDDLIVIDKPAGLVVHPGAGNDSGTLVNALLAHCGTSLSGIGGVARPGIVHRLDKDTTGLMVVAKTDLAHQDLSAQFADHGRTGLWSGPIWRWSGATPIPPPARSMRPSPARSATARRSPWCARGAAATRSPITASRPSSGRRSRWAWCAAGSRPDGPTRSACISRIAATPCSGMRSTARPSAPRRIAWTRGAPGPRCAGSPGPARGAPRLPPSAHRRIAALREQSAARHGPADRGADP